MKFKNMILGVVLGGLALAGNVAQAAIGFDLFSVPRTFVLQSPLTISVTNGTVTSLPADLVGSHGIASLDIVSSTNLGTPGGTMTAQVYSSADTTNWVALTNYALISTPTVSTITNFFYGSTNLIGTNSILLPGTPTVPVAATSLFATPYLAPLPFTNGGPVTITTAGYYKLGFNIEDNQRYFHVVFIPGGTATNSTVGASLTVLPVN